MASRDPISIVNRLDAALNAHDLNAIIALFVKEPAVNFVPPLPGQAGSYQGNEQLRELVRMILHGFRVESSEVEASGDRLRWTAVWINDHFRGLNVDAITCTPEARLQGDRIAMLSVIFTPDTIAQLEAATGGAQG